jgi:hypothetical protein
MNFMEIETLEALESKVNGILKNGKISIRGSEKGLMINVFLVNGHSHYEEYIDNIPPDKATAILNIIYAVLKTS